MISLKVCLIGASAVGKTSLVRRYVDGIFSDKYLTTIGVKIDKKLIELAREQVQLLVWDIEGTDKFSGFNARFLNGAAAYIVILDQSRPSTLEDALKLIDLARETSNAAGYLVINKSDLPNQLPDEQLEQVYQLGLSGIFYTSAKNGENVELLFETIAEQRVVANEPY